MTFFYLKNFYNLPGKRESEEDLKTTLSLCDNEITMNKVHKINNHYQNCRLFCAITAPAEQGRLAAKTSEDQTND